MAGGNSSDVNSKNFNDQAEMFTNGKFKEVLFYKEDILKNAVRTYQPGFWLITGNYFRWKWVDLKWWLSRVLIIDF